MYFKFDRQFNILQLDDTYARLVSIDNGGDLTFEFTYSINQLQAIQKNALTVNVSVLSRKVFGQQLLRDAKLGFLDTKLLINRILTQGLAAKAAIKEQGAYVVSFRSSDITAWINNEAIGQLKSGVPADEIPSLQTTNLVSKPVSELKDANETFPLFQFMGHSSILPENITQLTSASIDLNQTQAIFKSILSHGVDPSYVTQLTHRSVPAVSSFQGLLRPERSQELFWSPISQLVNSYILGDYADPFRTLTSQVPDSTIVQVAQTVTNDVIDIPINLVIPKTARVDGGSDTSHYMVKFDLIDSKTHAIVDSVIKLLDVARHIQLFYTPRKAPVVNLGNADASPHINLTIKQVDSSASSVQIFKKTLNRASVEVEDYVLVGTYPLTKQQQSLMVQVEKPVSSTSLYRVIPVGELGNRGFEYANVVARPTRYMPLKAVSLTARVTDVGVEIEIRNFPPSATSIDVLARNLTAHDREYRNVGGISLIDDATRVSDYLSVVDTSVFEGRVYEYVARVTYSDGISEISGNAVLEFIKATPGKVDLRITDLEVSSDVNEPNVTFNIRSIILDKNIDIVLALLKRQDIKEFFDNDVLREREFLNGLIAHNVQRVDLTTGQREDFGVIIDEFFDDKEFRKNNSVTPLKFGRKYRYEVVTLLRAPETMFEQFVKTSVDPITNKTYTFSPSKFLHPIVLTQGTIVTAAGLATRFSKAPMTHGMLGTSESIEVSFDDQPARIVDPSSARFNRQLNILTWKLEGSIDQIDHFLIVKDVHGVRTLIGKAHSEFEFGNCQYLHPLTIRDSGELRYVIIPVFNSYKMGIPAITNSVIVN